MTIVEEEYNIVARVELDMNKASDTEAINMIYKQARVWNRYHHFLAQACSYERYTYLNNKFKYLRKAALKKLGE